MSKVRNEIGYQQNHLGEQLLNIRGQIIKTNEERHKVEDDLQQLKRELKKTQWIDEVRQKEIYNAFIRGNKPQAQVINTQKIQDNQKNTFQFPKRPRPYYTYGDPYLDTNKI